MTRAESIELRCSACGEYMGRTAPNPRARWCSDPCERYGLALRAEEARDSMICEQAADGMAQNDIAEFHGISKQTVSNVVQRG